eukprot:4753502-Alexandrium_andersonii.AAC.1
MLRERPPLRTQPAARLGLQHLAALEGRGRQAVRWDVLRRGEITCCERVRESLFLALRWPS